MQIPFDLYPHNGRSQLGQKPDGTCRGGYGLILQRITKLSLCAYCGIDLIQSYHHWLLLSVDHVVPENEAKRLKIGRVMWNDYSNCVLTCSGCNTFANQWPKKDDVWRQANVPQEAWSWEQFWDLRNEAFMRRYSIIALRRAVELAKFEGHPWS